MDLLEKFNFDVFNDLDDEGILDLFNDTRLVESVDDVYSDMSEKILKLDDYLSEEIVLANIEEQMESEIDPFTERINYIYSYKEKYDALSPDDDLFDAGYLASSVYKVSELLKELFFKKYGVEIGTDLEDSDQAQYLDDCATLYEFLFLRQYENIVKYLFYKLKKNRTQFINSYSELAVEEPHLNDIFFNQMRKKFKDEGDTIIIHFINEIIDDIISSTTSAIDLFNETINLDLYEEINYKMSELIINYGNKIVVNDDAHAAELYFSPMKNSALRAEIKNDVLMRYLEDCEITEK